MTATWQELDNTKASTNAAPILKAGTAPKNAGFDIPNPLSFVAPAKRPLEYPAGHIPAGKYMHMETFKASQLWRGTPGAGRVHIAPERWLGIDAARANTPAPKKASATWRLGHTHYNEGVAASRTGTPATRYGRGFTFGYADFDAGVTHAHTHALASPPARFASAEGHKEYWAGVALGLTKPLTTPPAKNRAHIAGHKDYWDGVVHAHGNQHGTPPVGKLASVEGHNDYWAGVTHALANPATSPPAGKLASVAGHSDYWAGVTVALADLTNSLPPGPLGKTKGHADVVAGVTHARAHLRGTAPAAGSMATTAAFTGYWQGVDHARGNLQGTPCPIPGSAAAAGVTEWWQGVEKAATDLATLEGARPAGGGAGEGFDSYRAGVEEHKAGRPDNPAQPAFSRGWTDCAAGLGESKTYVAGTAATPSRTDGGFMSGYLHGAGIVTARAGRAAPAGALPDTVATKGHTGYLDGLQAARTDLNAAPPTGIAATRGHAEFVAGVTHARVNPRSTAPAAGSVATTAAFTEYWQGVDHARSNQPGTPCPIPGAAAAGGVTEYTAGVAHAVANAPGIAPPAGNTASAEGATDYWAGENLAGLQLPPPPAGPAATALAFTAFWSGVAHARANLANLQGAAPAGRVTGRGFAAYCQGVLQHQASQPNDPASLAFSVGWTDYDAGESAVRTNTVNLGRTDSGYVYAVQNTNAPAGKRKSDDPPEAGPGTKKHKK